MADIFAAANLLQLTEVIEECKIFMEKELSVDTCFDFLELAEIYHTECSDLAAKANEYILQNFTAVRNCSNFLKISKESFVQYLSSNELNTNGNESEVFKAIKDWLDHDEKRMQNKEELLSLVRFKTTKLETVLELADDELIDNSKETRALVRSALLYHNKILTQPLVNDMQNKPRGKDGFVTITGGKQHETGWKNLEENKIFKFSTDQGVNGLLVTKK